MPGIEKSNEATGALGNLESLLCEEIFFWRGYIQQCEGGRDESVPQRAFDALALAEQKLSLLQAPQLDGIEMDHLVH